MPHAGQGGNDTRRSGGRRALPARHRVGDRVSGTPHVDGALDVRVDRLAPGPTVVAVTGELDLAGVPTVRAQVRGPLLRGEPVVLDLGATTFLDVAGVRLLVALSREAAAVETGFSVLPALTPAVQLVLDLTGLGGSISFADADPRPSPGDRPGPGSPP